MHSDETCVARPRSGHPPSNHEPRVGSRFGFDSGAEDRWKIALCKFDLLRVKDGNELCVAVAGLWWTKMHQDQVARGPGFRIDAESFDRIRLNKELSIRTKPASAE